MKLPHRSLGKIVYTFRRPYVLAAVFHVLLLSGKKKAGLIADLIFKTGFLLHTAFIVTRGINVRRVPFVGHYEFGNLFIWATVLLYFLLKWRRRGKFNIVGAFLTLIVVLYLSYLIVVPVLFPSINIDRMHRALKPVLRSSWLKIHVSASAFGYAGFTLAFTAAVMWLLRSRLPEKKYPARIMPDCSTVEEFMYSAAVIGFLFQSIMIITGAVWADISWPLLGMGSQGSMGPDHLVRLCCLPACPPDPGLDGRQGCSIGADWLAGHAVYLDRGSLVANRYPFLRLKSSRQVTRKGNFFFKCLLSCRCTGGQKRIIKMNAADMPFMQNR